MVRDITQVKRISVVDEIVEQLTRRIISGDWAPGTVLPSLRTLAAETGVSMLTVREGIRTLQARGLVETRHGVGTFVRALDENERIAPWMLGASEADEYLELIEARQVIESAIIRFAAQRRTDGQLLQLEEILARMRTAHTDGEAFLEADSEFHVVLAEAAHNRVLLRSMLAIRGPMRRFMANRNVQHLETHATLDGPIADHEELVQVLRSGVADGPQDALQRIIDRAIAHLEHIKAEA
ncbi:FadR/GntR family transcriptional regulator [Rathayibacter soli]|uniref:FadR/GntR family transcriptional regulator n=1 Tax=Rathayibacter soli TaxID=3144168 RepID=UPI0027E4AF1D|nr:FadR/GntR family transcriptional regulator [Glaciibacter superstes]